jgi:hypothetical protein
LATALRLELNLSVLRIRRSGDASGASGGTGGLGIDAV